MFQTYWLIYQNCVSIRAEIRKLIVRSGIHLALTHSKRPGSVDLHLFDCTLRNLGFFCSRADQQTLEERRNALNLATKEDKRKKKKDKEDKKEKKEKKLRRKQPSEEGLIDSRNAINSSFKSYKYFPSRAQYLHD